MHLGKINALYTWDFQSNLMYGTQPKLRCYFFVLFIFFPLEAPFPISSLPLWRYFIGSKD